MLFWNLSLKFITLQFVRNPVFATNSDFLILYHCHPMSNTLDIKNYESNHISWKFQGLHHQVAKI